MASNRMVRDRISIVRCGVLRAAVVTTVAMLGLTVELAQPTRASAEFAAFLRIPEAPGESTDSHHKNEIDVAAYRQVTTPPTAGGCRFFIQQHVDTIAPGAHRRRDHGTSISVGHANARALWIQQLPFLEIRLTNAKVERVGVEGDTEDLPLTRPRRFASQRSRSSTFTRPSIRRLPGRQRHEPGELHRVLACPAVAAAAGSRLSAGRVARRRPLVTRARSRPPPCVVCPRNSGLVERTTSALEPHCAHRAAKACANDGGFEPGESCPDDRMWMPAPKARMVRGIPGRPKLVRRLEMTAIAVPRTRNMQHHPWLSAGSRFGLRCPRATPVVRRTPARRGSRGGAYVRPRRNGTARGVRGRRAPAAFGRDGLWTASVVEAIRFVVVSFPATRE
jgi:hypothetical protein